MKEIEVFSYREAYDDQFLLLHNKRETGIRDRYCEVEAQYQLEDGRYLVVVSLDQMAGEVLQCYLLDSEFHIQDHCHYTGWFTAFSVVSHQRLSSSSIEVLLTRGIRIIFEVGEKKQLFKMRPELRMTPVL